MRVLVVAGVLGFTACGGDGPFSRQAGLWRLATTLCEDNPEFRSVENGSPMERDGVEITLLVRSGGRVEQAVETDTCKWKQANTEFIEPGDYRITDSTREGATESCSPIGCTIDYGASYRGEEWRVTWECRAPVSTEPRPEWAWRTGLQWKDNSFFKETYAYSEDRLCENLWERE